MTDLNGNGLVDEGDSIQYTVVIINNGTVDALNVIFTDTPDANTSLSSGSVTTTQGTVTSGNGGESTVAVDVGTLAASGGTVTITYAVTVNTGLASGVSSVANSGLVTGSNFSNEPTDDPSVRRQVMTQQ